MRVLVTGMDGYIGTVLGPFLLDRGHDVVGLDTGFYRDAWLYNNGARRLPSVHNKDLRRITLDDVAGMEAVVHLAELSNDPLGQLSPHITYAINHQGSVALARLCKEAGVPRFVYTSSCSVYGVGGGSEYKTEISPPQPQTAYAECKVLVERDVTAMANATFSPTFLRNATAYGPSPRMRFDLVLNNLAGLAWTTKKIHMTSDGTPWRPLVHVLDICEAVACTLEAPREVVHNEVFNVGKTSENYQVREVAEVIAEVFPGCDLIFGAPNGDNRSYRVSFDKIATHLPGFRCRHNASSGARELYAVFERIGMACEIFESRAYTRLKQIQHLCATSQLDTDFFWQ
jgi:nucleoside-diphosphate-sugar epimerase